ncbi:MAG: alanine--glyoxylate aminotransferase family protein, partial [Chloroflexota bacterium]
KRAWQAQAQSKIPRFYFDLAAAKRYLERGQTPWTPAVSVLHSLDASREMLVNEGLENVFHRQAQVAQACRDGIKRLGLRLLADEAVASNTVTAVHVPEGVQGGKLLEMMETEYNVVLAGGQGSLSGKIFRVGHLGYCSLADIQGVLDALELALPRVGFTPAGARARSR